MDQPVSNPCINICRMDLERKYCQGCGRTLIEIGLWDQMTEAQRVDVMALLPERLPWSRGKSTGPTAT